MGESLYGRDMLTGLRLSQGRDERMVQVCFRPCCIRIKAASLKIVAGADWD
jgi:hypothetical protein